MPKLDNTDEMASLLPVRISKSVSDPFICFPCVMFREEQTKDLAVHKYPNLYGGRVENMGTNPAIYHVKAMLTNNIYPGYNENWKPGTLFPKVFSEIINLLNSPGNLILQHPIYGNSIVQVSLFNYELNPATGPRDGLALEVHFIETIDDTITNSMFFGTAPTVYQKATDLDNAIAGAPDGLNPPGLTLGQMFGKIANLITSAASFPAATIDAANLDIIANIVGVSDIGVAIGRAPSFVYNSVLAAIQNTKDAVRLATIRTDNAFRYGDSTAQAVRSVITLNNTPNKNVNQLIDKTVKTLIHLQQHYIDQNNSQAAPIIAAIKKLIAGLQVIQNQQTTNQLVSILTYETESNISWTELCKILKNKIDDLMGLNIDLMTSIWIPKNTTIKYYKKL